MITKPTVLVLGAGASIPYGYPSGAGLIQEIFQNIENNQWRSIYDGFGIQASEVNTFRAELHQSQKPSIDAFLEHRPEFIKVGKVAIALFLLSKENPDLLLDFDVRDKGIYHFLYNSLTTSWEEFKQNKLTIVTFNYNRSLEYFLFSALKHSYNRSDAEVAEAIQSTPIIHVHGSLGPLPWQVPGGNDYDPLFRSRDDTIGERIKVATENIVIVSEAQPKTQDFQFAFEQLKNAERIYFVGFGYYPVNLERLGITELKSVDTSLAESLAMPIGSLGKFQTEKFIIAQKSGKLHRYRIKHLRGSGLGLGTTQLQSIQKKWHIAIPDNKSNALEFLKEHAVLD